MFYVLEDAALCRCFDPVNVSYEPGSAQCHCILTGVLLTLNKDVESQLHDLVAEQHSR